MHRLPKAIQFIGWGDVPSSELSVVDNAAVLMRIERNLEPLAISPTLSCAADAKKELDKIRAHTPETVTEKLGIVSRQWYPDKTTTELAIIAAQRAVEVAQRNDSNFSVEKIGAIISGGSSPDDLYPCCAAKVQAAIQATDCEAYDVSLACCSGSQALIDAARICLTEHCQYALAVVGETIGSHCNDLLSEDSLLWGDGGGAVVISTMTDNNHNFGLLCAKSRIDGSLAYTTRSRGIGIHLDHRKGSLNASMEGYGRTIYKWVIGPIARALKEFLEQEKIEITDRTFFLPHNGNLRMVTAVGETIGIPPERILNRIAERGNQSSASVLSTLALYAEQGFFQRGDQLIMATFGGGVAYNFLVYRWP